MWGVLSKYGAIRTNIEIKQREMRSISSIEQTHVGTWDYSFSFLVTFFSFRPKLWAPTGTIRTKKIPPMTIFGVFFVPTNSIFIDVWSIFLYKLSHLWLNFVAHPSREVVIFYEICAISFYKQSIFLELIFIFNLIFNL